MESINILSAVCFGEMLFDMLPAGKKPGGAPMNVAIHLQNLGIQTGMISRIGNDELGKELLEFLRQKKVITDLVQVGQGEATGTVDVNIDRSDEPVYTIVEGVAWDFIDDSFLKYKDLNPKIIVFGSLACRTSRVKDSLLQLISSTSATTVFDLNLRAPFYDRSTLDDLLKVSNIVKLNESEFDLLKEWYRLKPGDERREMGAFCGLFPNVDILILTKGADGASALAKDTFVHVPAIPINVVDTIGSGDAFLGGFLSHYMRNNSVEEALKFAAATGAFVATKSGANPEYTVKEIDELMIT